MQEDLQHHTREQDCQGMLRVPSPAQAEHALAHHGWPVVNGRSRVVMVVMVVVVRLPAPTMWCTAPYSPAVLMTLS
jgi:hypothetical protein